MDSEKNRKVVVRGQRRWRKGFYVDGLEQSGAMEIAYIMFVVMHICSKSQTVHCQLDDFV